MVTEPRDPTLGISPSQGPWPPGRETWSQLNSRTGNSISWTNSDQSFFNFYNIAVLLMVFVSLCGVVGNGAVVWLLGFHLKRSPFSVYILNLACADGTFLLITGVLHILVLLQDYTLEIAAVVIGVQITSHMASLGLLMTISTERCVSVLCPLWHRCRRPAHLSCIVCVLVWGLALCVAILRLVYAMSMWRPWHSSDWFYRGTVVITFLVLCVSSLTLLVRVQCSSRGTRPSRLYVSILVTVLTFLLLALPYTVYVLVLTVSSSAVYIPALWDILGLLFVLNSAVNPFIYFFVGRYRQRAGRTPLQEVLQRALRDEEEEAEQGDIPVQPTTPQCPLNPGIRPPGTPDLS